VCQVKFIFQNWRCYLRPIGRYQFEVVQNIFLNKFDKEKEGMFSNIRSSIVALGLLKLKRTIRRKDIIIVIFPYKEEKYIDVNLVNQFLIPDSSIFLKEDFLAMINLKFETYNYWLMIIKSYTISMFQIWSVLIFLI